MVTRCKKCLKRNECESILWSPDIYHVDCNDFVLDSRKRFVLLHKYLETGFISIVDFSDSMKDLLELKLYMPHYGSLRHEYYVSENFPSSDSDSLTFVKDKNLVNICKNVAEYLSIGEYAMLKKSYFKASAWFEKAKNSASLGADILENY